MKSTALRRLGIAGVVILSLFTLTGCFKVAMNLDVKHNDTVDGSIVFALSKDVASLAGDQALSDAGLNPSDLTQLGAQVTTKPYDDGDFVGQEVDFTGAPLQQFSDGMSGGASATPSTDTFSLTHENGQYVFDATMDMSGALASQTGSDATSTAMLQSMLQNASFTVSVTFPGTVTETNGTISGTTVTWDLDLTGTNTLHAVAEEPHGLTALSNWLQDSTGMPLGTWVAILLALILLGGLAFLAFRHRGPAPTPAESTTGAEAAATSEGAPEQPPTHPSAPPAPPAGPTG